MALDEARGPCNLADVPTNADERTITGCIVPEQLFAVAPFCLTPPTAHEWHFFQTGPITASGLGPADASESRDHHVDGGRRN
jgi:hypothetical protein